MRPTLPPCALLFALLAAAPAAGQVRHEIAIPDLPDYTTLKCDLHMHTVFSDGTVWPTVRVDEAWLTGLDAIALTDHVEYQPHAEDLPTNHNRPYALAAGRARERGLLLPRAAEITRDTPPGHFNAIFLTDVDALQTDGLVQAMQAARKQDAFVFWNHHDWKGPEKGDWFEIHTQLYDQKLFQGMEVCNGETYFPRAHRWCLDKNLTLLGNSDIHGPDIRTSNTAADHRTLTLAFVTERTLDGLRQALRQGRTAVWFEDQVIGRREWLAPLFAACVQVDPPHLEDRGTCWLNVHNRSDLEFHLTRTAGPGPAELDLPPRSVYSLKVRRGAAAAPIEMGYTVDNFLVEPEQGLAVTLRPRKD
jgi:hypothetical protein